MMSFIETWKQRRLESKIAKYAHYLTQKTSSKEGRVQAMEFLRDIGSPEAITALLQRFRLTIPELTQDEEEKDYVCSLIKNFGVVAKGPLLHFIQHHDEVMKPLDLLGRLVSPDEMVDILIEQIKDVRELYSAMKTIKVVEVLRYLARFTSLKLVELGLSIITTIDDDEVILAAIEMLEHQADDKVRVPLLELAAQPETTMRIAIRIADMFVNLHWSIKGVAARKQLEAKLKNEFYTVTGGFLKKKTLETYG